MISSSTQAGVATKPVTLHLLSNFAVGSTPWSPYWQEQIASLQREALHFHPKDSEDIPSLTFTQDTSRSLATLFNTPPEQIEQWATWCTFICPSRRVSDTFLLLTLTCRKEIVGEYDALTSEKHQLVFRFRHHQHLQLLESIEQAEQVYLESAFDNSQLQVPFFDPELSTHLAHIRPLFR